MPIKGLTENTRFPRIAKFHLGIKVPAKKNPDVLIPQATDYFVIPKEGAQGGELRQQIIDLYGAEPRKLEIIFPIGDPEMVASQFYRCYQSSRGLVCRGDGEIARRVYDSKSKTFALPNKDTDVTLIKDDHPCLGRDCPDYTGRAGCRELMNLQFMLPRVSGLGIWQIDTSSINSIRNINSQIGEKGLVRQVYGRIDMVLLELTLEPMTVTPEGGKSKTVHVLNIRSSDNMVEAVLKSRQSTYELLVGKSDPAQAEKDIKELWDGSDGSPVLDASEVAERMTAEDIALAQAEGNIIDVEPEPEVTPPPPEAIKPEPEAEKPKTDLRRMPEPEEIKPVGDVSNTAAEIQPAQLHHMSQFVTKAGSNLKELGKWCHDKGWKIKEFNDLTVGQYLEIVKAFNKGNPSLM